MFIIHALLLYTLIDVYYPSIDLYTLLHGIEKPRCMVSAGHMEKIHEKQSNQ